jgi:ABC-type polysaccharide/polyol phosphate export permease
MTASCASADIRIDHEIVSRKNSGRRAINDLTQGFLSHRLWARLAWHDIRQRYHRSMIGPLWITISMGVMIAALGLLYAKLFGVSLTEYLPFLTLGFVVWNLVSPMFNDGARAFIESAALIKQTDMHYSIHIWRIMARNVIIFFHNILIFLFVAALFNSPVNLNWLFAIPGLFLSTLACAGAGLAAAVICARFRDAPNIIANVMQVGFFLTPIIWDRKMAPDRFIFVDYNPFYYLVELIRMPLLGQTPPLAVWGVGALLVVIFWGAAFGLFLTLRRRVAYWV